MVHTHTATDSRPHRDIISTDADAMRADVELASQEAHDQPEATGGEVMEATEETFPSFTADPEGFVRRYATQAACDEEAVRGLHSVLTRLRQEHQGLPCIRAEIRSYGGCPIYHVMAEVGYSTQ